jgi:hypothetical protein
MSTRSRIGMMLSDGTIKNIYCHHDGDVESVGNTLLNHYSDEDKIKELLLFGNLSVLEKNIHPEGEHSFDVPEPDVCIFYARDRGNEDEDADICSMEEYINNTMIHYSYLYLNNEWSVYDCFVKDGWDKVKDLL